jgi:hypothetical protein
MKTTPCAELLPDPTSDVQFHILSFEGPDPYARAGGIGSRITGLSEALAQTGLETHVWFVGDLPSRDVKSADSYGCIVRVSGSATITQPVYDGEEGKRADYAGSLPPYLLRERLLPHLRRGGRAVVLADEWQTVDAVLRLDWLLGHAGIAVCLGLALAFGLGSREVAGEVVRQRVQRGTLEP